ncbi:MAG: hypothetical protein EPN82_16925 [Bacteroidetes bacterium]|nr:MAG: hypothetical protein EPN82_16925 [Bacteroidota bacterium]
MRNCTIIIVLFVGLSLVQSVSAMPNFARKYGLACTSCHNGVPRLNEMGYLFRAAGYRMPADIGKEEKKIDIGDLIVARTQVRADWNQTESPTGAVTNNSKQINFAEFTFYPLTGAVTGNISSIIELSLASDEPFEIENAYVRYTTGQENSFFSCKAGIFHPFEGYGGSDRPLSLSRPLMQTSKASGSVFKSWGYDEVGIDVGYDFGNTSVHATLFNGILGSGEPAQGGGLVKTKGQPSFNNKDFQFFVNQRLTDDGGGISGYLYMGSTDKSSSEQNTFKRYAVYASYPISQLLLLGGVQAGGDDFNDSTGKSLSSVKNMGFFGEADYNISEPLWVGARFDNFNPNNDNSDAVMQAITVFANYSFYNGLQFIAEYQNRSNKQGSAGSQKINALQLRMILIY